MPNWCTNNVTFKNNDPELVTQLVNGFKDGKLFETFMPFPNDEWDYGWCIENWGTKWDVGDSYSNILNEHEPDYASFVFDTAWSPPIGFFNFMVENGWEVIATYEGEGYQFIGTYENGDEEYYDLELDLDWIKKNIPEPLVEEFDLIDRIGNELEWQKQVEEEDSPSS